MRVLFTTVKCVFGKRKEKKKHLKFCLFLLFLLKAKKSENKLTEKLVLGKLNNIIALKYQDVTPQYRQKNKESCLFLGAD